jgi:hypothetical protein
LAANCGGSLDSWREAVRKLLTFLGEGGLHDDSVDVLEVGNLLEGVVFRVVLQDLVEGVANQQGVLKFGKLTQLIELVPTFYPIV